VTVGRVLAAPLALLVAVGLAACLSTPHPSPPYTVPPESVTPPPVSGAVPDAIPRLEPRARKGNPPFYVVFGKRYYVLSSSVGYWERGVASWYGPGFHKVLTSTGERYDMYGMTAAHKTLPLPAYVRVTNLQNGRSVGQTHHNMGELLVRQGNHDDAVAAFERALAASSWGVVAIALGLLASRLL